MEKRKHYVNSLNFQIEFLGRTFNHLSKKFFKESNTNKLTFEEYILIDTLICYPHMDKTLMTKILMIEPEDIEKNINKLIKKNIIKETKNKSLEITISHYHLTENGNRIYQETISGNDEIIKILAKFITEKELLSFTKTLLKMRNILISLDYIE